MDLSGIHIILGSASPRRKQLLEALGWNIEVRIKDTSEDIPEQLKGHAIALHLAREKSTAFNGELKNNELLITADTIVCLDDIVLNKPFDASDAFKMLKALSGRTHQVFTGVCLAFRGERYTFYEESLVTFRKLADDEIRNYINNYKPFDKAGSYGAQECIPGDLDPCSGEENEFLAAIGKPDYFKKSLAIQSDLHVAFIEEIKGGYFNVMGLPVVKLWHEVKRLLNTK